MKKKLIVLFVVVALICAGAWFMLRPTAVTGPALAEMLPADTMIVVELINLEKTIEDFKTSRLGQKLTEIDMERVLLALDAPTEKIEKFKKIESEILSSIDSVVFKELFGRDTVIAVLPINMTQKEDFERVLSSVVLVSRTKRRAAVVEFINTLVSKQMETQTHKYNGHEITSLKADEKTTIFYVMVHDLMITAFDLETMKACLQLKTNNQASLVNNQYYRDLSGRLVTRESIIFIYNNTKGLYDNLVQLITAFAGGNDKNVKEAIEGFKDMKGFDAIAYSSYNDGSNLKRGRWLVVFDKSRMSPAYAKMYSFEPEENKTLGMIPEDAMVYYWANSLELSILKDYYIDNLKLDDATLNTIESKFMTITGLSLDQAANAFGNQGAFLITDIKAGGLFPVPMLGILLQAKDQNTVEKLIGSLIQQTRMTLEEEQVDGQTIKYLILPFGSDLQPAYGFYKGFFIISTNRQLLECIMDTDKAGNDITTAQAFRDVDKGLTDKNNAVSYLRVAVLLDKVKSLAELGRKTLGTAKPEVAKKGTAVLNSLVYPVLDGLKMFNSVGTRAVIRESEIEMTSCSKIED